MSLVPYSRFRIRPGAVALLLAAAAQAAAAVVFDGPVSPSTPPGGGVSTATLEIGEGDEPDEVDPRATVLIDGGSTLQFDEAYVGSDEGFFGRLFVSGDGSLFGDGTTFVVDDSGTSSEPALQVGREGDGYLLVEGGAWLDVADDEGDFSIGDEVTGVGEAVVTGDYTLVTIGQDLIVGRAGVGRLDVLDGAIVRTEDSSAAGITIGDLAGGVGEVYVDGDGTRLTSGDDLTVGDAGAGLLVISGGAIVDADNNDSAGATTVIGAEGRVTLHGGALLVNAFTINGVLGGDGLVRGSGSGVIAVGDAGRVDVGAGELLTFDDTFTNQGSINVSGGEIEFLETFTNNAQGSFAAPGRVTLESGRVRMTAALGNEGVIAATEGASDIHGEVTNETGASVLVARDAVLTFHDAFTDDGGTVDVLSGGNVLFLTDATFAAASTLSIGLDTETSTVGGAAVEVGGVATLAGALDVTVPTDYVATVGDSFTLLQATGGISGMFDTTSLPTLDPGLEFGLITSSTELILEVQIETVAVLDGDYNGDGVVDSLDYLAWREGIVPTTQLNYDIWAANYGATLDASSRSVPEPTALLLLAAAASAAAVRRR